MNQKTDFFLKNKSNNNNNKNNNNRDIKMIGIAFFITYRHLFKTGNNEHKWTLVKYLNILHHYRTQKQF